MAKARILVLEIWMLNQTSRINQSVSPTQKSRSIIADITDYFLTRIEGYPKASLFRITIYGLEGILIGLFFYLWLEYTQTTELFKTNYPIFVGFTIIFWHYLVTEFGGRFFISVKNPSQ